MALDFIDLPDSLIVTILYQVFNADKTDFFRFVSLNRSLFFFHDLVYQWSPINITKKSQMERIQKLDFTVQNSILVINCKGDYSSVFTHSGFLTLSTLSVECSYESLINYLNFLPVNLKVLKITLNKSNERISRSRVVNNILNTISWENPILEVHKLFKLLNKDRQTPQVKQLFICSSTPMVLSSTPLMSRTIKSGFKIQTKGFYLLLLCNLFVLSLTSIKLQMVDISLLFNENFIRHSVNLLPLIHGTTTNQQHLKHQLKHPFKNESLPFSLVSYFPCLTTLTIDSLSYKNMALWQKHAATLNIYLVDYLERYVYFKASFSSVWKPVKAYESPSIAPL